MSDYMKDKETILVSACLLGINCNYKGKNSLNRKVIDYIKDKNFIPICPEILGGFSTSRANAEIVGGCGHKVLTGEVKVIETDGKDVSQLFIKGAGEVLKIAKLSGAKKAILKARSPSCGVGETYDGTFSDKLVSGDGVLTALLRQKGIKVINDEEL